MTDSDRPKKIHKKTSYDPHYSDNWNTPKHAYEALLPFVAHYQKTNNIDQLVIWDPFFNSDGGTAKKYMEEVFGELGARIIHSDNWIDVTDSRIPEYAQETNLIITNPPYSKKNKLTTTKWMKEMELPFLSLMPTETMMLKCMRTHLKTGLQMIVPSGRLCFETKDGPTKSAPLGTSWFCFGLNLDTALNFLE